MWDGVGVGWSGYGMKVCEMEWVWDGVGVGWSGCGMEWVWDGVGVGWSGWHGVFEMECAGMEGVWVWDGVGVGWSVHRNEACVGWSVCGMG